MSAYKSRVTAPVRLIYCTLKLVVKKKKKEKKKQPCSFCIFRYFQVLLSHSGFHTTNSGFPRPDRCGMYLLDSKVTELSHMRFLARR